MVVVGGGGRVWQLFTIPNLSHSFTARENWVLSIRAENHLCSSYAGHANIDTVCWLFTKHTTIKKQLCNVVQPLQSGLWCGLHHCQIISIVCLLSVNGKMFYFFREKNGKLHCTFPQTDITVHLRQTLQSVVDQRSKHTHSPSCLYSPLLIPPENGTNETTTVVSSEALTNILF